jgi:hypothetical protein
MVSALHRVKLVNFFKKLQLAIPSSLDAIVVTSKIA